MEDQGVSSVLGAVMMMALMMTLVPGAILMRAAVSDEMQAQREAAERAAYCARNPDVGPPTCPDGSPLPGYECEQTAIDVWVCNRVGAKAPTPETPSPPAPTPTPTTLPTVPLVG